MFTVKSLYLIIHASNRKNKCVAKESSMKKTYVVAYCEGKTLAECCVYASKVSGILRKQKRVGVSFGGGNC